MNISELIRLFLCVAFPVSGMVTIPVSMYQTVVTNLNLQNEGNIMSAITGGTQLEGTNEEDNEDVKTVLNGQGSIRLSSNNDNS